MLWNIFKYWDEGFRLEFRIYGLGCGQTGDSLLSARDSGASHVNIYIVIMVYLSFAMKHSVCRFSIARINCALTHYVGKHIVQHAGCFRQTGVFSPSPFSYSSSLIPSLSPPPPLSVYRRGVFNQIYRSSWINPPERPYHFSSPQALSHSIVDDKTHTHIHRKSRDMYG